MFLIQVIMLLTASLMIAVPRACTKMESREDESALKRTRTMGIWLFFAAVIWFVTGKII